jgi:hypothetical protein
VRQWLRSHLTYANVMVTILAFVVLSGGTAVALSGSNTVFTDDITNDTQPASGGNPAGGLVAADLRPSSVGSSEVVNGSINPADVASGLRELVPAAVVLIGSNGSVAEEAHRAPVTGPPEVIRSNPGGYFLTFPGLPLGGNDLALCTYRGPADGLGGEIAAVVVPGELQVYLRSSSGALKNDSFQCAVYDL